MKKSPTRSVPLRTSTVATGPRPRSSFDSSTEPMAGRVGLAFRSGMSATSRIISSRVIEILLGARRNRHHDDIAAPVFGQQAAIGQLLLDAVDLRFRAGRSC